ncbi:MAG: RDD family protein, partial [Acidobacteria bacterium]|nr:RDD family protein [Acidobacteriota bacterium]
VPVADIDERIRAGALDAGFLVLACGFFIALFLSLGGHFVFGKTEFLITGASCALLYLAYFSLFTLLGPATPGMTLRGLTVVTFEGKPAGYHALLMRSFGYLLSGGSLGLGYAWAFWDDDHLSWQDRISQTYVTYAARPLVSNPNS